MRRDIIGTCAAFAAAWAFLAPAAQAQQREPGEGGPRRMQGPSDGEGGPGRREGRGHGPRERLEAIDRLGTRMALNPEQARLYGDLRAAAARMMGDRFPPRGADPFQEGAATGAAPGIVEADRAAVMAAGSKAFATLDPGQRRMLGEDWRRTFGPLVDGAGRHGDGPRHAEGSADGPPDAR